MFDIYTINKGFNMQITNYKIRKDDKYPKISKSSQVHFDKKKNNKHFNQKFDEYINRFISFISTNPNINLKLFYENLDNKQKNKIM